MSTVIYGWYTKDTIINFVNVLNNKWDWQSTDFSTENQWDFIIDDSKRFRVKVNGNATPFSVVLNGTEYSIATNGSTYTKYAVTTAKTALIIIFSNGSSAPTNTVSPSSSQKIIVTAATNIQIGEDEDVVLVGSSSNNSGFTMYASDVSTPGSTTIDTHLGALTTIFTPIGNTRSFCITKSVYTTTLSQLPSMGAITDVTLNGNNYAIAYNIAALDE